MKRPTGAGALRRLSGRALRDTRGAAMVEFALILPLLMLMLLGIIEMGRAWNVRQAITDAAREGARVAVVNNALMSEEDVVELVEETVRAAATRAGLVITPARLEITTTGASAGAGQPATVAVRYEYLPLFGTWILQTPTVPIRTNVVMRNE